MTHRRIELQGSQVVKIEEEQTAIGARLVEIGTPAKRTELGAEKVKAAVTKEKAAIAALVRRHTSGPACPLGWVKKCKMSLNFAPRTPHSIRIDVIQGRSNCPRFETPK